jgi:hypothetical protein
MLMDDLMDNRLEHVIISEIKVPELGKIELKITENWSGSDHTSLSEGQVVLTNSVNTLN